MGCGLSGGEYVSLGWHERDVLSTVVRHLRASKRWSKAGRAGLPEPTRGLDLHPGLLIRNPQILLRVWMFWVVLVRSRWSRTLREGRGSSRTKVEKS